MTGKRTHQISREEEAERDLGNTVWSAGSKSALFLTFLIVIFSVPCLQFLSDVRNHNKTSLATLSEIRPHKKSIIAFLSGHPFALFPKEDAIRAAETGIENSSALRRHLLIPTQKLLTDRLGVGTHQVYLGKDGWLFHSMDVGYVTAEPFLENKNRSRLMFDQFETVRRQLRAKGIELVLLPIPVKPQIYPEKLSRQVSEVQAPLENGSRKAFLAELTARGFHVFDPEPVLMAAKKSGTQMWLRTDSHWLPVSGGIVARSLADYLIRQRLTSPGFAVFTHKEKEIHFPGNMTEMMHLSSDDAASPHQPETLTTHEVRDADKKPHSCPASADVLVVGDSFSQIFSEGFHTREGALIDGAGLPDQLAFYLKKPVDLFAVTGLYPDQIGEKVRTELATDKVRIGCKRVVIWEFIERQVVEPWKADGWGI